MLTGVFTTEGMRVTPCHVDENHELQFCFGSVKRTFLGSDVFSDTGPEAEGKLV
jgi:hypothetical protein